MRFLFVADKEFTVFLTITDRTFTSNLNDIESLEFLNLAEKLQVAVRESFSFKVKLRANFFFWMAFMTFDVFLFADLNIVCYLRFITARSDVFSVRIAWIEKLLL